MWRINTNISIGCIGRHVFSTVVLAVAFSISSGPVLADANGFLGTRVTILAGYQERPAEDEVFETALYQVIVTDDVELASMRSVRGLTSPRGGRIVDASIDITTNSIVIRFRENSRFSFTGGLFAGYIFIFPDLSRSDLAGASLDARYRLRGMTDDSISLVGNSVRINFASRVASRFTVVRINFPDSVPLGV